MLDIDHKTNAAPMILAPSRLCAIAAVLVAVRAFATNECNPASSCNVCAECCKDYIPDGTSCDSCVAAKCAVKNSCAPKSCNVCAKCCAAWIPAGENCDKCVNEECGPAPAPTPPQPPQPPPPPPGKCTGKSASLEITQCKTWIQFYDSVSGSTSIEKHCPGSRHDPCSCHDSSQPAIVNCNGGSITEMTLHKIGMAGSLPTSLTQLTDITFLNLPDNELTGTVPPSLSQMSKLQILSFGGNKLTGAIPASLSNLALKGLDLQCNNFDGPLSLNYSSWPSTTCTAGGPTNGACVLGKGKNQWSCPLPPEAAQKCGASCK